MTNGNGGARLTYWLLNILSLVLISVLGAWAVDLSDKVKTLEQEKKALANDVVEIKWDVKAARADLCRMENSFSELRGEVTRKPVYRRECP